ncbi:MAG: helix-turn-helix domain-containing protein [Microcystaceae cyanobacterium]
MSQRSIIKIIADDLEIQNMIPESDYFKVITKPTLNLSDEQNLLIFTTITSLSDIAECIRLANQKHHLKGLFIRADIEAKWLTQILDQANLRVLRTTLVYDNLDTAKRVINAWDWDAQDQLIADATVIQDKLLVVNCAMERLEIPCDTMLALENIPQKERVNFSISEEGSYLYWESQDIHLDFDSFKSVIDPDYKAKCKAKKLMHNKLFGKAIATLRKQHKLRQSDIIGLSDRQVHRIEKGENTKVETLKLLANAHGMKLNDYLNAVASLISAIPEEMFDNVVQESSEDLSLDDVRKMFGTEETVQVKNINANIN